MKLSICNARLNYILLIFNFKCNNDPNKQFTRFDFIFNNVLEHTFFSFIKFLSVEFYKCKFK